MKIDIKKAVEILTTGGIIVYPTETAYAIGCDATNEHAVKKIIKIKKRSGSKTFALIAATIEQAEEYAVFSKRAYELAKKYWPGPLTLVLPAKKSLPREVINEKNEIGIRVSSHVIAKELSLKLSKPIIATSANSTGEKTCYTIECVKEQFKDVQDLYIIDSGSLRIKDVSTVVRVKDSNHEVLRAGAIDI